MGTVNACFRPTPVIPGIPVNFLKAAFPVVPIRQSVLTLSVNSGHSPDTENSDDAEFLVSLAESRAKTLASATECNHLN
jgi:hypothetical protein